MVSENRSRNFHGNDTTHYGSRPVCPARFARPTETHRCSDRIRVATAALHHELIDAEAAAFIGATPFECSTDRTTHRNSSRLRTLSATAGGLGFTIAKLGQGTFFRALLERRRRVGQALFATAMEDLDLLRGSAVIRPVLVRMPRIVDSDVVAHLQSRRILPRKRIALETLLAPKRLQAD